MQQAEGKQKKRQTKNKRAEQIKPRLFLSDTRNLGLQPYTKE